MQSTNTVHHFALPRQLDVPAPSSASSQVYQSESRQAPRRTDTRPRSNTRSTIRTDTRTTQSQATQANPRFNAANQPASEGIVDELLATTCSQINWAAVLASLGTGALALASKYGPQLLALLQKAICKSSGTTLPTVPGLPSLNPLVPVLPIGNQKSAILRPGQGTEADSGQTSDTIDYPTPYIPENEGVSVNKRRYSGISFRSKRWRRGFSGPEDAASTAAASTAPPTIPVPVAGVPPKVDV